jgi:hypothetical protein
VRRARSQLSEFVGSDAVIRVGPSEEMLGGPTKVRVERLYRWRVKVQAAEPSARPQSKAVSADGLIMLGTIWSIEPVEH